MAKKKTTQVPAEAADLIEPINQMEQELAERNQQLEQLLESSKSSKPATRKPRAKTIHLFNEAELLQNHKAPEPTKDVLKAHASMTPDKPAIKVMEVELSLQPKDRFCPKCGSPLIKTRKDFAYEELDLTDEYLLIKHIPCSYHCPNCKNGSNYITKPLPPFLKQSMISPYTAACVMTHKFHNWSSLDKQNKTLAKNRIDVDIGAMANWIIRSTDNWLKPLYRHMKQELLKQSVIHVANAPVQMVSDDGTPIPSDSRMYAYVAGNRCTPIFLFEYNRKQPDHFLKGFTGCLVSDCSPEYTKIQTATHCGCWLHLNALWKEALAEGPETSDNKALDALLLCGKLLTQEQKCLRMSNKARMEYRHNLIASTVEEFFLWTNTVNAAPGSKLAAAVTYTKEHKAELSAFLDHGEVSSVNAMAEGALEPFTTGKKVWQFSATPKGAQSSTLVYSIIQTAHENGIYPFDYLCYILSELPRLSKTPSHDELEALMPWNPNVKKICNDEE